MYDAILLVRDYIGLEVNGLRRALLMAEKALESAHGGGAPRRVVLFAGRLQAIPGCAVTSTVAVGLGDEESRGRQRLVLDRREEVSGRVVAATFFRVVVASG